PAPGRILAAAEAGGSGSAAQGLHIATPAAAIVTAPFDGEIVYAGPLQPYVLALIIRHTDGYHSLLAGLGRADSAVGQWVLAGEPLGVMPDAVEPGSGGEIFFELDRKSTRLNSSHSQISYAVFCLKKKTLAHICAPL